MRKFSVILFDEFETLDVFGPVEVIGTVNDKYDISYYSQRGGIVTSVHDVQCITKPFSELTDSFVLFVPGGGTSYLTKDDQYLMQLKDLADHAEYVLTVCTGSGLLAKTGFLDGRKATTNKMLYEWSAGFGPAVEWIAKARWVKDGKIYTSSGVSAGIDMTLDYVKDIHGYEEAKRVADYIEYSWNEDSSADPFALLYGLVDQ
jgi:transcriptional regulator GlxA family with amidase domain